MRVSTFAAIAAAIAPSGNAQPVGKSDYGLTDPAPRDALRELSTDRPDKTESPYTVDAGHVQIEIDLATFSRDRDRSGGGDVRTETLGIVPVNVKLGLTNSTDVQLLVDPYVRQTIRDRTTGACQTRSGFGDVTIRVKQNLWGNDGGATALALMPFVTLPTSSNGAGTGSVEFGLIVPLAIGVSDRVGMGLMTEVDLVEASDGDGHTARFINSANVSFDLTGKLGAYAELFTQRSAERGAKWIVTGDLGLTYAMADNLQLDGGMNLGITDAADDLELFVGVSRRF